ncbi:MAG: deoxyribonuclease IV [Deltaproteobacteria bacterium]|nr:deoxyribonuclease IV [Deltaproteobacteria bacterium]
MRRKKLKDQKPPCLLGAHFSIARGLDKALFEAKSYGCNTLQIFTKNANAWKERIVTQKEIENFEQAKLETGITEIASHTSYLINPATPEKKKHKMSINALLQELVRSSNLGIPYVVLHPGSHMEAGEKEGILRIAESIDEIFAKTPGISTRLLLETTAGQGSSVGHTFEQLASIISKVEKKINLGVCLDTCHIFAAGYDIRTMEYYRKTMDDFDSIIGLDRLSFIHLNDSKKELGSRVDRHEQIGRGYIGLDAFKYIMNDDRFFDIPKIIETPKGEPKGKPKGKTDKDWDETNLKLLRGLVQT